jgi:hypothetical protein
LIVPIFQDDIDSQEVLMDKLKEENKNLKKVKDNLGNRGVEVKIFKNSKNK